MKGHIQVTVAELIEALMFCLCLTDMRQLSCHSRVCSFNCQSSKLILVYVFLFHIKCVILRTSIGMFVLYGTAYYTRTLLKIILKVRLFYTTFIKVLSDPPHLLSGRNQGLLSSPDVTCCHICFSCLLSAGSRHANQTGAKEIQTQVTLMLMIR